MKGISGWHHHPYRPFNQADEARKPFICRLAPSMNGTELEWFDHGSAGAHEILFRRMKSYGEWACIPADEPVVHIDGLEPYVDYELCVVRADNPKACSAVRYFRTGHAPGAVVNYLHPEDKLYAFSGRSLCSPSLVKLPTGALLASMDVFAGGQPQNLTLLFRSDDGGQSWRYVNDLFPCYWGTLFVHRGVLYMLSTQTEYGNVLIGCSHDEGKTWSKPVTLFYGSGSMLAAGWQHTPTPLIVHNGRLCTSIDYGAWSCGGHGICLLSCEEDADLLDPDSWTVSPPVRYDPSWPGAPVGKSGGLLEGSVVTAPDGSLIDLLRLQIGDCKPSHGLAAALKAGDSPEEPLAFHSFVKMPTGSNSKTHVEYDPVSGRYVGVGNLCVDEKTPGQRNVLVMESSADLINWKVDKIILDYRHMSVHDVGFQYIFFAFDGDDLLVLSRTSINAARNFHDANYQTFHRVENFRQYL